ncbi:MAG: hypothetical protein JNL46_09470 [Sphingosinicella sp.]|nr:hypothetical protein [Sphingosinicella sp.]
MRIAEFSQKMFGKIQKKIKKLNLATFATATIIANPAFSSTNLEIPQDYSNLSSDEYRVSFHIIENDSLSLMQKHKEKCNKLGPTRCRILQFMPGSDIDGEQGSIRFLLLEGSTPSFISEVSKSTKSGFAVSHENRITPQQQDDLIVERQLLFAQREEILSIKESDSEKFSMIVQNKRSEIESRITNIERQLKNYSKSQSVDTLYISYEKRNFRNSRWKRDIEEYGGIFFMAILAISGIALLTGIYFGIIFLVFLWLKKFSVKRGLLKG